MNFIEGEVLLLDKELGWTSFDVVKSLRNSVMKKLNIKKVKVGHAGTLDPLATGLLIVCTGKKTKDIDNYQAADKIYTGTITIGATRPSFDLETEIDKTFDYQSITEAQLHQAAKNLEGDIMQVPPLFSAIKVEGVRAYQLARDNKEVELKQRPITIHYFKITNISLPDIHFEIKCSKGTYIRSIARDFGLELNNGAFLSSLRRTAIGDFLVVNASTVEQTKNLISNS